MKPLPLKSDYDIVASALQNPSNEQTALHRIMAENRKWKHSSAYWHRLACSRCESPVGCEPCYAAEKEAEDE